MKLSRRTFMAGAAAATLAPAASRSQATPFAPQPSAWRTFEIRTTVEIADAAKGAQVWVPVPAVEAADWTKPGASTIRAGEGRSRLVADPSSGAVMAHVAWPAGSQAAAAEVISTFSVRDRAVPATATSGAAALSDVDRRRYTAATALQPTDGIVRETAERITAGATSEIDKARRLYEWIVVNTVRDPKTRGCGTGDIAAMLKSGNLSGKCADLNALYVGLARASGLPARDLYGIRVAPSQFGYKSLGANSPTVTRAQHCRAEVFITGIGWFPVDPADVRKVILEEPPGTLKLGDAPVEAARAALFGSWETNWLAYNDAHDVVLPGSSGPAVPFLMYPQAETAAGRLDCLDPDTFRYTITARQIEA